MITNIIPMNNGVSDKEIDKAEITLSHKFPLDLRQLLKKANGAYIEPDWFIVSWPTEEGDSAELLQLHYFFPLDSIISENLALSERFPPDTLAIGQDPGGALLLIQTRGKNTGAISFWRMAYDPHGEGDNTHGVGVIAPSLSKFITSMEPEPDFT